MSVGGANAIVQNRVVFTSQWQNGLSISWNPPCSTKPTKRKFDEAFQSDEEDDEASEVTLSSIIIILIIIIILFKSHCI